MAVLFAWAIFVCTPGAFAQNTNLNYWQGQNIYQIITDRFFDGDTSNDNVEGTFNASNVQSVHGGDFAGIQQKLDYLKSLGVTAIWISPIISNTEGQFHGYSGYNFTAVAPHWGNLAALQSMVQAAHAKGILVVLDIVVNHAGDLVNSSSSGYPNYSPPPGGYALKYASNSKTYPAPFNLTATNPALTNLWHNYGNIGNFNDLTQTQLGQLSGLNDFRTETQYIRDTMATVYENWIGSVGFDGFRVDTVYEVETGFWQSWCPAVHAYAASNGLPNFFMFGEIFNGSESLVGSFTGTQGGGAFKLDSTLDYPLFFMTQSIFATASGNTQQIESHYANLSANYDSTAQNRLVTFLDNHDNARFLSSGLANNNTNRLAAALAFLYTSRGIPCLYYGTEQAFNGGTDPNDREDMFGGQFKDGAAGVDSFNMTHPLFQLVAKLNNLRRLYPAMSLGSHVNQWSDSGAPGLLAYSRRMSTNQEVFVAMNTSGSTQSLPSRTTIYPAGTVLVNLLNTNETITNLSAAQTPSISIPTMTAKIFIAQSQVLPLDPVVISNSPSHATTGVPTWSPIVFQFSKPMDTNSVQNAFAMTPPLGGTYSWTPSRDTMTFQPSGAGLPGLSNIVVRLTNSAMDSVSSNKFFGGYELKFTTAASSFHDTNAPVSAITNAPASNSMVSGIVNLSGTASDNIAVMNVQISLDASTWFNAAGTTSWSYNLNTSNFLNGLHTLYERAVDTTTNYSVTNTLALVFNNIPGAYIQRMSGGNATNVVDCSGNTWVADAGYTAGRFGYVNGAAGFLSTSITGICANSQSLYQREHFSTSSGGFYYQFDCPEGVYEITLLEAETYWTAASNRQFNIFIQGKQVKTNFDIFAVAGGANKPISLVFTNAVTNAQLQVLFTPFIDNARVSGIQAKKITDVFSDSDGIPDWWRLAYFNHAIGSAADLSRGGDDADGDGMSNYAEYRAGTNPLNSSSVFKITAVHPSATNVMVSWSTITNHTYQLQRRVDLGASGAWSNISSTIPGTGGIASQVDPSAPAATAQYYRVQVN